MIPLKSVRIGYDPFSADLSHPGDNRRFCFLAKLLNIKYEIYNPQNNYDLVILNEISDISYWRRIRQGPKIIFNQNDSFLAEKFNFKTALRGLGKYLSGQQKFLELSFQNALKGMCRNADAVICSTEEQKVDIEKYCKNTHIFFEASFFAGKNKKMSYESHKPFKLIWEGLPTNTYQLLEFSELISNSKLKDKVELHIVTDRYGYKFLNRFFKFETEKFLKKFQLNHTSMSGQLKMYRKFP